ncbi:MAG: amidohydrolase family protein, partial [Pseudomonadales bacterium]
MHDLIIRNGTIVDGSGEPSFEGDIAVDGDKIVAAGKVEGKAKREIDASGHLVTPGWVDVHTHYDGQATWDSILAPSSWHGVTTVVMGNCGVGFAPVRPGDRQFLIELMEGVEDIPGSALAEGIEWNWESFPEYLDALESRKRTIDVGAQVPHGAVRAYAMGARCNTKDDLPTDEELALMCELVREGVKAGALGFSSSRTFLHRDTHGVHVPGTFAGSDEMLALGLAMKGLGHRVFEMVSDYLGEENEWTWVKQFARETGLPVTLVNTSPMAKGQTIFDIAEEAEREGMDIRPQAAGRPTGILHGLQSSFHAFVRHPTYAKEIAHLPHDEKIAKMKDSAVRAKILGEKSEMGRTIMAASPEELLWMVFPLGEVPNYEPDREDSVAGLAKAQGKDPFEMMYDLLVGEDGKELFYQPLGGYRDYDLNSRRDSMAHPKVLYGLSDGGAHCGIIADAGTTGAVLSGLSQHLEMMFPSRVLQCVGSAMTQGTGMAIITAAF